MTVGSLALLLAGGCGLVTAGAAVLACLAYRAHRVDLVLINSACGVIAFAFGVVNLYLWASSGSPPPR